MSQPPHPPLPENEEPRTQAIAVPAPGRQEEPAAHSTGPVDRQPAAPATTAFAVDRPTPGPVAGDATPPAQHRPAGQAPASRPGPSGSTAAGQPTGGPESGDDDHVHRTGPMDHVPVPPPLRPEDGRSGGPRSSATRPARARDRAATTALGLAVLALVVLQLGLTLRFGGATRLWNAVPTWSAFATVAALLLVVPAVAGMRRTAGGAARTAWQVAAGGAIGLAVFWVLLALPLGASDRGFTLTAALALAGGAVWLSPGRER